MLKQRLITAVVLIPFVIWSVLYASTQGFTYGLAVVLAIAAFEWNNFVSYKNKISGYLFIVIVTSCFIYIEYLADLQLIQYVIYISLIWWLISIPLLFGFPFNSSHFLQKKPFKVVIGFIILLSTFLALNLLRNSTDYGVDYIVYFLLLIWVADSGAYFVGRAWGKHKLIPNVSPGKSWEGVAGAMVATLITAFVAVELLNIPSTQLFIFVVVALITVAYSIVGDLSESMFKRMANVKDSGKILPGHGGILDRIDSLTSGLPVFLAGLWLMESLG